MKILVVDDEQDICEILQYNLELEGYEVVTANSAEEAFSINSQLSAQPNGMLSQERTFSLILLDVMMEGMSGFEMARKLKENPDTANIPIIFITALDSEDDMVKGLNIGADDYIAKPLSMREVKARVAAVLRRSPSAADTLVHNTLTLYLEAKTATLDGQLLTLTKLEFELLSLLLKHPNHVFSRDELLKHCWPQNVYVLDRTVDVNITRLRKKIGQYGRLLKTRVGYGYYFEK